MKQSLSAVLSVALGAALPLAASAQSYPVKPIRLVVPYAAGGATDSYARLYARKFTEAWGQTVVVDNRPGAGSNLGASVVAKAPPAGYPLLPHPPGFPPPPFFRKLPDFEVPPRL